MLVTCTLLHVLVSEGRTLTATQVRGSASQAPASISFQTCGTVLSSHSTTEDAGTPWAGLTGCCEPRQWPAPGVHLSFHLSRLAFMGWSYSTTGKALGLHTANWALTSDIHT